MRITLEQIRLLKSLQVVERAINDRSALPILANILLEAKEQELILTATDLDVGVRYHLPLSEKSDQGAVTLPARRLTTIVRELPSEPIIIEVKKNHTTALSCGASHFRIPGLPPEDFPVFPHQEHTAAATLSQAVLKTLIAQTAFAMSMEETRFILNGALLRIREGTVTLVATDGRRLAVASSQGASPQPDTSIDVVVPAKTIRELGRLLQEGEDGEVAIAPLKDNQLLFQFGAVTVMTRLVDGQFPNHESVIPAPVQTTLACHRQLLVGAIRRASLMTTATSQAVVFELDKDRLVVSKESTELGSAREELPARYTGAPMTIAFNPEFWLDVLRVLESEDMCVELTTPEKPAVVRLPNFLYLVLPMKLT